MHCPCTYELRPACDTQCKYVAICMNADCMLPVNSCCRCVTHGACIGKQNTFGQYLVRVQQVSNRSFCQSITKCLHAHSFTGHNAFPVDDSPRSRACYPCACRGEQGYLRAVRRGPWRRGRYWEGIYSASYPTLTPPSKLEAGNTTAAMADLAKLPLCPSPPAPPPRLKGTASRKVG